MINAVAFSINRPQKRIIINYLSFSYKLTFIDNSGKNSNSKVEIQISSIEKINQVLLPDDSKIGISYRNINELYVIEYIYHPTGATEKLTSYYNERGDVIRTQYPEFSTSQEFNGMGHKFETVNPWGITTRYTLDDLGRSQLETRNSPHLLTVEKSFDDESHGEQLTEIKINGKVVGRRQYDKLHRVISESKGTYTTRYTYETHSYHPTKVISPDGSSIEYALNLTLDEAMEYRASDGVHYLSQKYSYYKDNNLSQKILIDEAYKVSTETYIYDDFGRLKGFTADGQLSPSYLDKGPIRRQSFTLDPLNNVIETKTTFMQQGNNTVTNLVGDHKNSTLAEINQLKGGLFTRPMVKPYTNSRAVSTTIRSFFY